MTSPTTKHNPVGFWAYLSTLFLGAFNDNVSKILVICYGTAVLGKESQAANNFLSIASACFILPYLLFSTLSGYLADRYSKRVVMILAKVAEIVIMAVGLWMCYLGAVYGLLLVLFCMGTQSAFFSPAKYGFLPETQPAESLPKANGYTQLWTFLAIIAGGALGGPLSARCGDSPAMGFWFCIAIAVLGTLTSFPITRTAPGQPQLKFTVRDPITPHLKTIREMCADPLLIRGLLGNTYFWFVGTIMQLTLMLLVQNTLKGDDNMVGFLQAAVALGIGVGCVVAGIFSRGTVAYRFVSPAAFALAITAGALAIWGNLVIPAFVLTTVAGFCAGFYTLPLTTALQKRSPEAQRGRCLAAANTLDCISMCLATALLWGLRTAGCGPRGVIAVIAALTAVVGLLHLIPIRDNSEPAQK